MKGNVVSELIIPVDDELHLQTEDGQVVVSSRYIAERFGVPIARFKKDNVTGLEILDIASRHSFEHPQKIGELLCMTDIAETMILSDSNKSFPFLFHSVRSLIITNFNNCIPKEKDIHELFNRNASKLIEGCKVKSLKANSKYIPDSWVSINDELCPVEIKLHAFDLKALNQLNRYIEYYKASKGIAVGNELKVTLPSNIVFIPIEDLNRVDGY